MQMKVIGNRYQIHDTAADQVGRGGMGNVYRATDAQLGKQVAVKHLKSDGLTLDTTNVERFEREGEALRRLNHPNIVTVFETVEEEGEHYIIMEYVSGGSLRQLLSEEMQLPIPQVLKIALELADALTRAHHLNIIHRDIKPANVLLAEDGTPRLTDFGVAHMEGLARITQTGMLTGTYAYLSPEACEGSVLDGRADIWSFGVVLYEMLSGKRPFEENQLAATITAILTKPIPDLTQFRPDVPEALTNLIYRMLHKDRQKRIGSVRLVGAQLEAIMAGMANTNQAGSSRFETTTASELAMVIGPRHNLPTQPTPFVGRESEVAQIAALLGEPDCRLLSLIGPGGMGKTRLSIEVALRKVDDFRHGVRFVGLAAVSTAEFIVTAIAEALNFSFDAGKDPQTQLVTHLRSKEMLLLLDNFEHLLDGADIVSDILAQAPRVKILATSRESLNLWEEWSRPVRGMLYPDSSDLTDIDPYSAVKLFADRARRVRGGFSLEEALPQVVRICQLVEGMPLGIELAATWLKVLSPDQIVQEIEKNFDFLTTSMRNIAERHRSIRAVFDYSWQLLSAKEKEVFRRLSVFRGGFSRQAAEEIAGASLMTLTSLVNKSLLYDGDKATAEPTAVEGVLPGYTMHELLKQYAAEKLAENEAEAAVVRAKHALYYAHFVYGRESDLKGENQKSALDVMSASIEDIRTAWCWLVTHLKESPAALMALFQAIEGIYIFYENRGHTQEGVDMFARATTAVQEQMPTADLALYRALWGRLLSRQAIFAFRSGRLVQSDELFQASLTIFDELMADTAVFTTLAESTRWAIQHDLALSLVYASYNIARTQSQEAGKQMILRATEVCEWIDDQWVLARAKNAVANQSIHFSERRQFYQEGLAIARAIGDKVYTALLLFNLVNTASEPEEAHVMIEECVQIYKSLENPNGLGMAYGLLGMTAYRQGDYLTAKTHGMKARVIYEDMGMMMSLVPIFRQLSYISWALGELEEAQTYLEQVIALVKEGDDLEAAVKAFNALGLFLLETKDAYQEAKEYYKTSRSILPQITSLRQKAEALDSLGNFAIALGDYGQAKKHFQENILYFQETNDLTGEAWAVRNFGLIAYELGDYEVAQAQFEESLALHQQTEQAFAIMALLNDMGRVAYATDDVLAAEAYYRKAFAVRQNYWTVLVRLEILVDWMSLLIKAGERERALAYLTIVRQHPLFVPPVSGRRTRQKAARLIAELEADMPMKTLAGIKLRVRNQTIDDVIEALTAVQDTAVTP